MDKRIRYIGFLLPSFFILGRFIGRRNKVIASDDLSFLKVDKIVSENPLDANIPRTIDVDDIINSSIIRTLSPIAHDENIYSYYDPILEGLPTIKVPVDSRVNGKELTINYDQTLPKIPGNKGRA